MGTSPPSISQLKYILTSLLNITHFPISQNFTAEFSVSRNPNNSNKNLRNFRDWNRKMARVDLDGNPIKPITICMIGAGGFIGSHLCEKLMEETPHKVLAVDVYNDKIKHLLEPSNLADRIEFHRINIKNDSRLEGLIRMADLVIIFALLAFAVLFSTL